MIIRLATISLVVNVLLATAAVSVYASDEVSPADLKRKADAALVTRWRAGGTEQAEIVFAYADYLRNIGDRKQALKYMNQVLQKRPWDLARQLQYAELLEATGDTSRANGLYRMISATAEDDALVEQARVRLGTQPPLLIPDGPPLTSDETVVLVGLGKSEPILFEEIASEIEKQLNINVVIRDFNISIPEPDRDQHHQFLEHLRQRMLSQPDDPDLARELKKQKTTISALADDAAFVSFLVSSDSDKNLQTVLDELKGKRQQWNALTLLSQFKKATHESAHSNVKYLALSPLDIYDGRSDYILWQTQQDHAIISYCRFKGDFNNEPSNRDRLRRRMITSAVSCIGSMYGIDPCTNSKCPHAVLHSLTELDAKNQPLCSACQAEFQRAFGQPVLTASADKRAD